MHGQSPIDPTFRSSDSLISTTKYKQMDCENITDKEQYSLQLESTLLYYPLNTQYKY